MQRPYFASREEYGKRFTSVDYWQAYIASICQRHNLAPYQQIRAGKAGTHPVFIVDERYVVKLYAELFGGDESFRKELDLYQLCAYAPELPVPQLITYGSLFAEGSEYHWPYTISTVIPGVPIGSVLSEISFEDKLGVATAAGSFLHVFHRLPLEHSLMFERSWEPFRAVLAYQRKHCIEHHRQWNALPQRLIAQIEDYLPPVESLFDQQTIPYLLHTDLFDDHVLGFLEHGCWHTNGIIDLGDALVGDRLYELIALHIGLFHGDKRLLRAFMQTCGLTNAPEEEFVLKTMSFALLRQFNVFQQVFDDSPEALTLPTLHELATFMWGDIHASA